MWLTRKTVDFIAGKDKEHNRSTCGKNERVEYFHIQFSFKPFSHMKFVLNLENRYQILE